VSEYAFWVGAGMVAFAYAGYPALIALLAILRPQCVRRADITPTVSLVIAAYNEAGHLARKLENCLQLDYPPDRLEIIVASDGSHDATVMVATAFQGRGITVMAFPTRRGKPAILDDVLPRCRGDIVVLSDSRQLYERSALRTLVQNFADPRVGAVSGELHFAQDPEHPGVGRGVGFYWRYEKLIRRAESRFDSTVGATGAIYAIRHELFEPIPVDTLVDDVLIPLRIVWRGYRVVFEPGARAFDQAARSSREEFVRKVRTIAGTLQLFSRERWLWTPLTNRLWFQTISHKLFRILGPFALVAMLVSSLLLARTSLFYGAALGAQMVFYGLAGLGFCGKRIGRRSWVAVPHAFCLLNIAALVGVLRFVTRSQAVTWQRASDVEYA
jgi:cellulose synthase/poly-beta-1,6-N-acetylglucosamine synthase-like glycosyltransferase